VNIQHELSLKLEDTINIILNGLIAGNILYADETGCRVNASLKGYMYSVMTDLLCLVLILRGALKMRSLGF
jgi:hypothetical protein